MEDKKILRKRLQQQRDALPLKARIQKSKIIAKKFIQSPEYKDSKNILIYYPFRSEIDTTFIMKKALRDGKKIILPKVSGNDLKLFFIHDLKKQLTLGTFDIMEPSGDGCIRADIRDIDLAVIPGVCFDVSFNRLGYGGGFYDRVIPLLSEKIKKIAICFDLQLILSIPVEEHDQKIDKIITEKRTLSRERDLNANPESDTAILIPAFNEAKYIEDVITSCSRYGLDIIIVDDGSKDKTVEIIEDLIQEKDLKISLIKHEKNRGKGEALKTGFKYALAKHYNGVITLDADGQHNVNEISTFLETLQKESPDLIVGSRFKNVRSMPFIRLATNFFTSWLISLIAGRKIDDVQSGFRFIGFRALKNIKLETKNFDTEPEILLKASWLGYKIINVPITTIYHQDFVSHVNPFIDTLKFFRLVFRSVAQKRSFKRYHTML